MFRSIGFACAAGLALAAGPAAAEGWSITKLGTMATVDECMQKARKVISAYMFDKGGAETGADSWSIYGYDLEPGAQDVVIVCPVGASEQVNAMLVIQSESEPADRKAVSDALLRLWDGE
ncbi:MAG: hypothetical protein D6801_02295 [Alphaproteobacteria bacterium]|nr:MAG: hypothetical protein D6801_02295 [Alphaproteobacteria bacterium]